MDFGQKVKTLRKQKGWSQAMLAQKLAVSLRTISAYESGLNLPRTRQTYQTLATLFDVSVDYLLTEQPTLPQEGSVTQTLVGQMEALFADTALSQREKDEVLQAIQQAYWKQKGIE